MKYLSSIFGKVSLQRPSFINKCSVFRAKISDIVKGAIINACARLIFWREGKERDPDVINFSKLLQLQFPNFWYEGIKVF